MLTFFTQSLSTITAICHFVLRHSVITPNSDCFSIKNLKFSGLVVGLELFFKLAGYYRVLVIILEPNILELFHKIAIPQHFTTTCSLSDATDSDFPLDMLLFLFPCLSPLNSNFLFRFLPSKSANSTFSLSLLCLKERKFSAIVSTRAVSKLYNPHGIFRHEIFETRVLAFKGNHAVGLKITFRGMVLILFYHFSNLFYLAL